MNKWLITGGVLSCLASLLHVGVIIGGPAWYRFFGAGEALARGAERGSLIPPLITLAIATILLIWGLYAFSGAGLIRRLPLLQTGLVVISAVYLVRGLAPFPMFIAKPHLAHGFPLWSSLIVLVYGITYAVGTFRAWPALSAAR